jgi:thiamine-phosphate pyrophosphorylase
LAEADIAAVLLRLAESDERTLIKRIKALAPTVQNSGAALLIDSRPDLVIRSGADGAHVSGAETTKTALSSLKPNYIVGVGGMASRHDAMVAGEDGADYLLFGEPGENGARPSAEAIAERIAWWAELFSPPCVAYAGTIEEAGMFAKAGADFVLLGDALWNDPRGEEAALADAARAIHQAQTRP